DDSQEEQLLEQIRDIAPGEETVGEEAAGNDQQEEQRPDDEIGRHQPVAAEIQDERTHAGSSAAALRRSTERTASAMIASSPMALSRISPTTWPCDMTKTRSDSPATSGSSELISSTPTPDSPIRRMMR